MNRASPQWLNAAVTDWRKTPVNRFDLQPVKNFEPLLG
jgi:hypothetical protein